LLLLPLLLLPLRLLVLAPLLLLSSCAAAMSLSTFGLGAAVFLPFSPADVLATEA
jgi:hypothetical protein